MKTTAKKTKKGAKAYALSARTKRRLDQERLDRYELEYLAICRRVATFLGGNLHGSSDGAGCTVSPPRLVGTGNCDVPHWVVRRIASFLGIDVDLGVHREAELPHDLHDRRTGDRG